MNRRGQSFLCALALFGGGLILPLSAQAPTLAEIQAVFLFNFSQFVGWPAEAFNGAEDEFVIGVIGNDPFGKFLDETVRGETAKERKIAVRRFKSPDEIKNCHILFVAESEQYRLGAILDKLKGRPILSVSDIGDFARKGGVINFVVREDKIRFQVNMESAKKAGLTISSKILRAAETVSDSK